MSTITAAPDRTRTRSLALLLLCVATMSSYGPAADKAGLNVHMLSGSKEYKSEQSLKLWAQHLKETLAISSGGATRFIGTMPV